MTELHWSGMVPALPEMVMALCGMLLLVVGVFRGNAGTSAVGAAAAAVCALVAAILMALDWDAGAAFGGMFLLDRFTGFMKLFILAGLAASLALSIRYIRAEGMERFEYPVLVLFAGLGMMLMVSANSLLSLYVGLELQSLALYVLAAIRRDSPKAAEAGVKYFVLGALASGFLLFGMSLVYGYTGSLSFDVIRTSVSQAGVAGPGLAAGMVFILAGFAFKVSAAPFHMWTPDVYEGAPSAVTALFAIVPKVAAMTALMRLLFGPFGPVAADWQQVVWILSALSMGVGAFAALMQDNIKRLMAYSSIGNMGYALAGLAAGTAEGAQAVALYLIIYMVMTAGVFGLILAMRRGGAAQETVSGLAGLSRTNPVMAYAMAILMFSMAGIPPMAGFFGKLFVFKAVVGAELYWLAVLGVLSSVVAAFYYLRIVKVMFFDEPAGTMDGTQPSFARSAVVAGSVLFVLLFILQPNFLVETSREAVAVLFL